MTQLKEEYYPKTMWNMQLFLIFLGRHLSCFMLYGGQSHHCQVKHNYVFVFTWRLYMVLQMCQVPSSQGVDCGDFVLDRLAQSTTIFFTVSIISD